MYHPSRGGVRGGRDQFSWDDVKVDKHRENYLGHSVKAPVGRWQKGKDLHWYTRDKGSGGPESDALKEEIKRIKEEEEQAMREALGLAPKRSNRPQANRLDKHELSELVKRGSTAEDLGAGHSEAAFVHGLGFSRTPRPWEDPSTLASGQKEGAPELVKEPMSMPATNNAVENVLKDDISRNKRRHEERGQDKHEKQEERKRDKHEKRGKHEKRQSRDLGDKRKHKKDKERRRHDSDSD